MRKLAFLFGILFLLTASPAFAQETPNSHIGEIKQVGNGLIYSWVTQDEDKKPLAVGITFTETALSGLPTEDSEMGHMLPLSFPYQAWMTPFNHVSFDWNPHGHQPAEIYGLPHFDIHFYMISQNKRDRMVVTNNDYSRFEIPFRNGYQPINYQTVEGNAVPKMGNHWFDITSPEFHGQIFTKTFIYGSYNGSMVFMEPMITKAYLETHPNVSVSIPQPQKYDKPGRYYPTTYSIHYNERRKEYTIALEDMIRR